MDGTKNFAKAVVSDGNYDDSATSIDLLVVGAGLRFPAAPFNATWWNATDYPDPADDPNVEIVRVTDITDDTLTITRGQEGTAAVEHNTAGKTYQLIAGLTAGAMAQLQPISYDGDSMEIDSKDGNLTIGDVQDIGNGTKLAINDGLNVVLLLGKLCSNQKESATVAVGTLAGKLALYDADGTTLLGYLPIYGSIT